MILINDSGKFQMTDSKQMSLNANLDETNGSCRQYRELSCRYPEQYLTNILFSNKNCYLMHWVFQY